MLRSCLFYFGSICGYIRFRAYAVIAVAIATAMHRHVVCMSHSLCVRAEADTLLLNIMCIFSNLLQLPLKSYNAFGIYTY